MADTGTTLDASLYGNITFASVADNVRIDLPACVAADDDITRYCKLAWHELIHTYPALQRYFNPTDGTITPIPENAPDDADAFAITLDGRRIPIEAYIRSLIDVRSALKQEQLARIKIDNATFESEQGIQQGT